MTSIREQLEQAILLGEFSSGSHLDESQLASRFKVSRTPIREALKQLVASGLLEHRPNKGVFVRTPSVQELLEMFEVMAELEALCVKLAARRTRGEDMQTLQKLADDCEQAMNSGDHDLYSRAIVIWSSRRLPCTVACNPTVDCNCACRTACASR